MRNKPPVLGLLVNRRSRRNRHGLAGIDAILAERPEVVPALLDDIADLPQALRDLAARGVDLLAINGGDGTVQAVLTELMNGRPFPEPPPLAVLAGGTTNMIAGDVGLRGGPAPALRRLVARLDDPALLTEAVERAVIRVEHRPGEPPMFGMFFGTAAIYRAILFCRRMAAAVSMPSGFASAVTLAGVLGRRLVRRGEAADEVVRGDDMAVRFDDGPPLQGRRLLALVTTLDRLVLGSRPFWGNGPGDLRYSEVAYPPAGLFRAVLPFMYGGEARRLPSDDYCSRSARRIAIEMHCPFTLDGELFDVTPGVPVRLDEGGRVRFVRC